jgi:hypothetical protein
MSECFLIVNDAKLLLLGILQASVSISQEEGIITFSR